MSDDEKVCANPALCKGEDKFPTENFCENQQKPDDQPTEKENRLQIERECTDRNAKPAPGKKINQTKDQTKPEDLDVDPDTAIGFCSATCVSNDCVIHANRTPLLESLTHVPCNLPLKYEHPHWFNGYGCQRNAQHPFYRTSANEYGWCTPGIIHIPSVYYGKPQKFSNFMTKTGMYRNYCLNTSLDSGGMQSGKMCS